MVKANIHRSCSIRFPWVLNTAFHLVNEKAESRHQRATLTQTFPTPRTAHSCVVGTRIVKRRDEVRTEEENATGEVVKPGLHITKDTSLEIYDALVGSMRSGQPYQTRLALAAGGTRCRHPARL